MEATMIPIITGLVSLASSYIQGKQEITKAKTEANIVGLNAEAEIKKAKAVAAMELAKQGQSQTHDLDRIAMEQMNKSWKDELILIIFLAPMVLAFIPGMESYALAGFKVIGEMPEWYQYIIIGMVVVIYGMRGLLEKLLERKVGLK
jgi:hypothetical protein